MTRRLLCLPLLLLAATLAAVAQQPPPQPAQAQRSAPPPAPPQTHLKVGDPAPDFTLIDTERKQVKLSELKGKKNVVLAFYVLAFTGG